jgi:NAD(P)-dependent dehydrogenase (short-subunit alcohol dehydrogenase family)
VGADREHHVDHRAIGNFGQANYAASKGRLAAFSTSLAKELVSKGITVNCVAPGVTDTEMVMAMPEKVRMKLLEQIAGSCDGPRRPQLPGAGVIGRHAEQCGRLAT